MHARASTLTLHIAANVYFVKYNKTEMKCNEKTRDEYEITLVATVN